MTSHLYGGTARPFSRAAEPEDPLSHPEFAGPAPVKRDLKKLFLVTGLGALSWVATYVGMLELIEANMGDLPLVHKAIIGFSVAMLMTMIIWLLDQMFAPHGLLTKLTYVAGYLFLTIISVGFGFGFYWKVLESRSESSRSAESAVTQVQTSLHAASTRLEQLNATLVQLAAVSSEKATLERDKGTSCPNSKPGDGPRRKMRDEDAARFSFASDFVKGRVEAVNADMAGLNADLAKIASADASTFDAKSGTRNEFMKALSRKLDMTVTGFNAFRTDPQLRQLRTDLDERALRSTFGDPKSGGFVCPDPQLQQALKGAVRAIDQLPELKKPEIAAVEGSEATIEAFRRLTATFYGLLSFKMPPSADELRELQQKAVQSVEGGAVPKELSQEAVGLSKRDYVPLAVAIFVDICLLLVSIGRPVNRLHSLVPKMREAEQGPVIEILSRFKDIHRDREVRESFELFRHVVFDLNGDYYVAVPLDAPPRMNPQQREQLRLEAQLLSNLFASFEKERIFTRTWTPFTRRVQAKLRKQGSKFAEAEAFRVYRFRKGAWSEIILGAVMGAARRAEAERRRRGEVFGSSLAPSVAETYRVEPPFVRSEPVRPPYMAPRPAIHPASRTASVAQRGPAQTLWGETPYTAGSWPPVAEPMHPGAMPPVAMVPVPPHDNVAPFPVRGTPRRGEPQAGGERYSSFGAYARSAEAELSQETTGAEPNFAAHNNNTAPSARQVAVSGGVAPAPGGAGPSGSAAQPAGIVTQPVAAPVAVASAAAAAAVAQAEPVAVPLVSKSEPAVEVVLRRETVSIPVSEAMLKSLPSLLARAASQTRSTEGAAVVSTAGTAPMIAASIAEEPVIEAVAALSGPADAVQPGTALVLAGEMGEAGNEDTFEATQDWSDTDVTLVRRFRPEAAE